MKNIKKSVAALLALLMLISVLPMSVFAEGAAQTVSFDLIVDNNDQNDADVTADPDCPEGSEDSDVPAGKDLYNGLTPAGLKLDWDAWATIFPDDDTTANQDISFTLWRETGKEAISSEEKLEELGDSAYGEKEKISIISDNSIVRVLNVYPCPESEPLLKSWLALAYGSEAEAQKHFSVDTVLLDKTALAQKGQSVAADYKAFNDDANSFLKDADGNYKYDVIFFGTSDGNGDIEGTEGRKFYDLSEGAYNATKAFIDYGKGVLFGHDTVCSADHLDGDKTDGYGFDYFTKFAEEGYLDIEMLVGSQQNGIANEVTNSVKVTNKGLLTSYPFTISENLTVPGTHSLYQKIDPAKSSATVWMKLQDSNDADSIYSIGDAFSAYLFTNKNLAMIQTGHSSLMDGDNGATADEAKVIANTLFYLMQKSIGDYSTDGGFVDNEVPEIADAEASIISGSINPTDGTKPQTFSAKVEANAEDFGTAYKYYVDATRDGGNVGTSNEVEALAISNLKGYIVTVNKSDAPIASNMIDSHKDANDTTGRLINVDVEAAGAPDSEKVSFTPDNVSGLAGLQSGETYWLHVVPVDNANNCGAEVIVKINLEELYDPTIDTEIEAVPSVDEDDPTYDSRVETEEVTDEATGETTEVITNVNYYPHNYEDKNGEKFDELQQDEEVEIKATASVDTGKREDVIGVITLVKWEDDFDGDVQRTYTGDGADDSIQLDALNNEGLDKVIEYGDANEMTITLPIDEIYKEDLGDYLSDGKYTATITWYEKDAEGNPDTTKDPVSTDECDFTIVQPDYKVTFEYKYEDGYSIKDDGKSETIVKYGDSATEPAIDKMVSNPYHNYKFTKWDKPLGPITEDITIKALYKHSVPNGPVVPEEEEPAEPEKEPELIRLGGEDRVKTALKISQEGWDKSKVVILATANQFPDAMAGVPLAKAVDAPILLTYNRESLELEVKAEIARLHPEKIYILGQTDAVNANIERELKALMYEVERVGGKDRFGTAVEIAYEMEEVYGVKADAVYFVRSDLFPDALSVSSVAAIKHDPILYVAPNGKVDEPTTEYCKTIGTDATIIGGPEAVIEAGENNIKALFRNVDRIYGADRYATSVKVCTANANIFTGDGTALATGKKFPDALTGGSFAAKNNIPVLLVNGSVSSDLAVYLANRPITKLYVFGGELAVSDEVAYSALSYCEYPYY